MRKALLIGTASLVGLLSCQSKGEKKAARPDLVVRAVKMDSLTYLVRLSVPAEILGQLDGKSVENIVYRSDSSIYLQEGKDRYYPLQIEPVANGNRSLFEFLATFPGATKGKLIYRDKYINGRTYPLI